jgi:hypothetical protein
VHVFSYVSEPVEGPFPCWVCTREMTWAPGGVYSCMSCEVTEARVRRYVNRTRLLASVLDPVTGEVIRFIDHAAENVPSPA